MLIDFIEVCFTYAFCATGVILKRIFRLRLEAEFVERATMSKFAAGDQILITKLIIGKSITHY